MAIEKIFLSIIVFISLAISPVYGQPPIKAAQVSEMVRHANLVAFWDFDERSDSGWMSTGGKESFCLKSIGNIPHVNEGPLSGSAIELDGRSAYLTLPHSLSGGLNVQTNQVTVIAWVKWEGGIGFVAGKWNEYDSGGRRQYGLFVSLPHYNGGDQVCGHISKMGGPTDPFPYSIDYSASKRRVPKGGWACVAFTYDGMYIKSYLNGVFEAREPEWIEHTAGFLKDKPQGIIQQKNPYFYPYGIGNNRSDFTVGAVELKSGMGNFFKGQVGGIAVFDVALSEEEMARLAIMPITSEVNHN